MHIQTNLYSNIFNTRLLLTKGLAEVWREIKLNGMRMLKDITFHLMCLEEDHLVPISDFVSQLKTQELYLEDIFSTGSEYTAEVIKVCY